jgi:hypothetical protein
MYPLEPSERDCLTCIARGDACGRVCPEAVLRRLIALGLIESSPTRCLPLEMPSHALRLTPAGRAALDPD